MIAIIFIVFFLIMTFLILSGQVFLAIFIGGPGVLIATSIALGIQKAAREKEILNLLDGIDFIGEKITDIENVVGVHTDIRINADGSRTYVWDNYLELLTNKKNVCIEELKNVSKTTN